MALRLARADTATLTPANVGSSSSASSGGGAALFATGIALMAVGFPLAFYGTSDSCTFNNPGTTSCDGYSNGGITLAISGLALFVVGKVMKDNSAPPISQPPAGGRHTSPPPVVEPLWGEPRTSAAEAQKAREAIDRINAGPHGNLSAPDVIGNCSGSVTTVTVNNGTEYQLSVYLIGPQSRTLTVFPSGRTTVELAPGHYDVAASVTEPNVLPFSGTWSLARGCPYRREFVISATR